MGLQSRVMTKVYRFKYIACALPSPPTPHTKLPRILFEGFTYTHHHHHHNNPFIYIFCVCIYILFMETISRALADVVGDGTAWRAGGRGAVLQNAKG